MYLVSCHRRLLWSHLFIRLLKHLYEMSTLILQNLSLVIKESELMTCELINTRKIAALRPAFF